MSAVSLKAIVLSAGKGTRMKSERAKVLHPVLGWPLGHYAVARAFETGAAPVVVVVGHGRAEVEAELARAFGDRAKTAVQDEQRGTGHAARIGLAALDAADTGSDDDSVIILYGDTPLLMTTTLRALVDARAKTGAPLAMLTMRLRDPTGYGRIVRDDEGRVLKIVEHKDANDDVRTIDEVNPGIYVVARGFLRRALADLKNDNAQGEYYLTDIVERATEQMDTDSAGIPTLEVSPDETLGVNDRRQLAEASAVLRRREIARHQSAGVTFEMPESVYLEENVTIGADTIVGPFVTLRRGAHIGSRVVVESGVVIARSVIHDDAIIHAHSVVEDAEVGARASVGPFARLRPEAVLEEDTKVGNFVEVKKARLKKGAKANHLAYIGDAEVGERTNIGAGTITCNYDGIGKHKTTLGDDVFIGSNSTLVAPITVESGAYVGAGSTVSRDVPSGALAISRARQENKEGYADKIRARNAARKKARPSS
jgi:bifunctional UDP-N-acetylglucosamine pyrophosphorylase/glucosamine-1-phosphate N-acetyltransferase